MFKFDKPVSLNGNQLRKELINAGVTIIDDFSTVVIDGNNEMWLDISVGDEAKAKTIVSNHVGIDESISKTLQRQQLLTKLGITADEAALLLG